MSPQSCITLVADVDECVDPSPCDTNAMCTNTPGSYTCDCNAGYTGDGVTCTGKYLAIDYIFMYHKLAICDWHT